MSEYTIARRQLFILPTRIGWYYALITLALFAIAVKFDNQPAFMMLFLLVAIGIITMHHTHNNVIGLQMEALPAKPVFVNESANYPLRINNPQKKSCDSLWLVSGSYEHLFGLTAQQQVQINISQVAKQRGFMPCQRITLTSSFPLGIFFCWSKSYQNPHHCLVYPQPRDLIPLPENSLISSQQDTAMQRHAAQEEMNGLRSYQPGDRIRDVHWASLAKTGKLVVVDYEALSSNTRNISWFSLPAHMPTEDKLSQLCHWLLQAEQENQRYQLEMPNHTIEFSVGQTHLHQCLKVLALWEAGEPDAG